MESSFLIGILLLLLYSFYNREVSAFLPLCVELLVVNWMLVANWKPLLVSPSDNKKRSPYIHMYRLLNLCLFIHLLITIQSQSKSDIAMAHHLHRKTGLNILYLRWMHTICFDRYQCLLLYPDIGSYRILFPVLSVVSRSRETQPLHPCLHIRLNCYTVHTRRKLYIWLLHLSIWSNYVLRIIWKLPGIQALQISII